MQESKWRILNANHLKLIAAATMLLDHMGILLFPYVLIFRILGRLSYPIFAFMVAEGCHYTKNKWRHLGLIAGLGVICQVVYFLVSGSDRINVLLTFSGSILLIYALQTAYHGTTWKRKLLGAVAFGVGCLGFYALDQVLLIDYGFWGMMVPVFVAFARLQKFPHWGMVLALGVGMVLMSIGYIAIQNYALLALPIMMLYSGKPGKRKMKYFFYFFYPAHLAALQGLTMLLAVL